MSDPNTGAMEFLDSLDAPEAPAAEPAAEAPAPAAEPAAEPAAPAAERAVPSPGHPGWPVRARAWP